MLHRLLRERNGEPDVKHAGYDVKLTAWPGTIGDTVSFRIRSFKSYNLNIRSIVSKPAQVACAKYNSSWVGLTKAEHFERNGAA